MDEKLTEALAFVELHVNEDACRRPKLMALLVRNVVVEVSGYVPMDDRETFRKFMRIVSELDLVFGLTE
jgi:hypothetical protein